MQTSKCIATLEGHIRTVFSTSFSHDGKYLATASQDGTVKIWDNWRKDTEECLVTLKAHPGIMVVSVSFSPNGRYVASGAKGRTVKIWDMQTFQCIATLTGHIDRVTQVSFSGDGKYLASSSADRTVRIWVNVDGGWYCDKVLGAFESSLSAYHAKVELVIASKQNKALLKQLANKGEVKENSSFEEGKDNDSKDEEADQAQGEIEHNPTFERATANEISEQFLTKNIARNDELIQKAFAQLNSVLIQKELLKPDLIHTSLADPRDIRKEKEKVKEPGDINSKSAYKKHKNSCCNSF